MTKVSVICPVFNASKSILPFLEAMESQTLDEIEIVLIDDHGQDDSMERARQWVSCHDTTKRVLFIDGKQNNGPGIARNLGIQAATGEYVAFIDSDDQVDADYLERLFLASSTYGTDLTCGSIAFHYPDGTIVKKGNPRIENGLFDKKKKRFFLRHYKSYFTTFLYRRAFLIDNDIIFPPTRSAEDSCFLTCCLLAAIRIAEAPEVTYHYLLHDTSVSRKKDSQRWKNRINSFRRVRTYAQEKRLYPTYWAQIEWLILKKGYLLALKDLISNI